MSTNHPLISRGRGLGRCLFRWFLFLIAWAALGVVVSAFVTPRSLMQELPRPVAAGIIELGVMLYALGFLAPLPVLVSHYSPIRSGNRVRALIVHVLAAVAFTLLHWWVVKYSMDQVFDLPRGMMPGRGLGHGRGPGAGGRAEMHLWLSMLRNAGTALIGYWLVVGAWHAVDSSRKLRAREVQATQLEAQLATARLQALEDQLHPHFLFNTLNTLSSLIYEDVAAADKVIRDLSALLRLALDNAGTHTVALAEEVRFVELYLEIMKTRYPDRLQVDMHIHPDTLSVEVPNLLLQPIVENSIKHGLEATGGTGEVTVSSGIDGHRLWVEILDNGPGLGGDSVEGGVGLRNTRDRLAQLYGDDCGFTIANRDDGGGVRVRVELPVAGVSRGT